MKNRVAAIFIFLFIVVAILPLFQQIFKPIKLAGLQGAFDSGTQPPLSFAGWMNGSFQSGTDQYLKYNTAFNGELVRLRNQLDYSLFGNINTILTLGKENYIFDPNYILSREGKNLIDDASKLKKDIAFTQTVQLLDLLNVPLLIVFAPNKANYYAEYLPLAITISENTNKNLFLKVALENGVNVIDFDSWFLAKKSGAMFPLIPKYGAHWSTFGASLAADSILSIIGTIINKKCASFNTTAFETSEKPRFADDDYLASLNLIQKFKSPVMAYPVLEFNDGYKPNVLVISDSFIWNFYDLGIAQTCFDEKSALWYYQKTHFDIYKNNFGPLSGSVSNYELKDRDLVIILTSDPGLTNFGYGFFEQVAALK